MESYSISIIESARRDLDDIFRYIAYEIGVPEAALDTIEAIEKAILSLEQYAV